MFLEETIDAGRLVLTFSDALDLAEPVLRKHHQRVAYIVLRMCRSGKFSSDSVRAFYTAALFHDIGAFSLKEKMALKTFEFMDVSRHAEIGYILLKDNFWLTREASIIRYHHRQWADWKRSRHNLTEDVVLGSQLLNLADYVDRLLNINQCVLHQSSRIIDEIVSLSGEYFHKYVVDLFMENAKKEEFWLNLVADDLTEFLFKENPLKHVKVNFTLLVTLSELFRNVIDFRSRFTATHSVGVSAAASIIGEIMGFSKREVAMLEVAGNLHDIGKLVIPDFILEKPSKLEEKEFKLMIKHVFYTYYILRSVKGLEQITKWASFHHERLDGSGYPFHLHGDEIDLGARILMVADIFTALVEERPYREGMKEKDVVSFLRKMADKGKIDGKIVKTVIDNYGEIYSKVIEVQTRAVKEYELKFTSIKY